MSSDSQYAFIQHIPLGFSLFLAVPIQPTIQKKKQILQHHQTAVATATAGSSRTEATTERLIKLHSNSSNSRKDLFLK